MDQALDVLGITFEHGYKNITKFAYSVDQRGYCKGTNNHNLHPRSISYDIKEHVGTVKFLNFLRLCKEVIITASILTSKHVATCNQTIRLV